MCCSVDINYKKCIRKDKKMVMIDSDIDVGIQADFFTKEAIHSQQAKKMYELALNLQAYSGDKQVRDCIARLEQAVIASGDAKYVISFAKNIHEADIKRMEHQIISSKDARLAYYFARDIKGSDKEALQRAVVDSKDAMYACLFACNVKDADIATLQKIVIDSKVPGFAYIFARDIKGADIPALRKMVIESKDKEYAKKFSRDIMKGTYAKYLLLNYVADKLKQRTL